MEDSLRGWSGGSLCSISIGLTVWRMAYVGGPDGALCSIAIGFIVLGMPDVGGAKAEGHTL